MVPFSIIMVVYFSITIYTVELILIRTYDDIAEAQQRHHTLQIDIAWRVKEVDAVGSLYRL